MDDLPFLKGSWSIRKISLSNGEKDFKVSGPVCLNINGARWALNLMSNDVHTLTKFISPHPRIIYYSNRIYNENWNEIYLLAVFCFCKTGVND